MSITANSKILASDVSGKIDTAGTGLTKSGTTLSLASLHSAASTIGSSSAQTLAYSGTFTIPYVTRDVYGRVSGGGTRTITMPSAPSGGTVGYTATWYAHYNHPNSYRYGVGTFSQGSASYDSYYYTKWKAPAGGTWAIMQDNTALYSVIAGGSTANTTRSCVAIRIA